MMILLRYIALQFYVLQVVRQSLQSRKREVDAKCCVAVLNVQAPPPSKKKKKSTTVYIYWYF